MYRALPSTYRMRPRKRFLIHLLVASLFVLLVLPLPSYADVVDSHTGNTNGTNHAAPAPLTGLSYNLAVKCGRVRATVAVAGTVNAAGTVGLLAISLPLACRGQTLTFNNPGIYFTAVNNIDSGLSLVSNSWTSNMGTVRVCVSPVGRGCLTSQLTLTSTSAPPLATSLRSLTNGNTYGPWIRTTLGNPGGSATIVLDLYQEFRNTATRSYAAIQVDTLTLIITQN